jgi:hypothetical protein
MRRQNDERRMDAVGAPSPVRRSRGLFRVRFSAWLSEDAEDVEDPGRRRIALISKRVSWPRDPPGSGEDPFPWMSETIDLGKEKNFFESRVTEYRRGASLSWE